MQKNKIIHIQWLGWGGAMGHCPNQQKDDPLTDKIAILNIQRNFMCKMGKWR